MNYRMYGRRSFRRRRRYGGAFTRRSKPGLMTTNHCEMTTVTTGGVELQTAVFTSTSSPSNRGATIPEGSILKKVVIRLWATDATPVTGKHQCFLVKRPGATVFTTGPITNWYLTTDPVTEEMIDVRRYAMSKRPHTLVTITGASGPPRMTCFWKGNWPMRDGDDVVLAQLDASATNWTLECHASYIM